MVVPIQRYSPKLVKASAGPGGDVKVAVMEPVATSRPTIVVPDLPQTSLLRQSYAMSYRPLAPNDDIMLPVVS